MTKEFLDEREFELINIIGAKLGSNQRDLSRQMDLSLGQTNMLIRRLVSKGFIRISQLNKKKVKYLLTTKGLAEKMRKSVKYTLNTINSISLIKEKIKQTVVSLYNNGEREFVILGKSDFATLIEMVFQEMRLVDYKIIYIDQLPQKRMNGTLLVCREEFEVVDQYFENTFNLIEELAKSDELIRMSN
jgi:DNA-binding MarR family transcriptional regulator